MWSGFAIVFVEQGTTIQRLRKTSHNCAHSEKKVAQDLRRTKMKSRATLRTQADCILTGAGFEPAFLSKTELESVALNQLGHPVISQ